MISLFLKNLCGPPLPSLKHCMDFLISHRITFCVIIVKNYKLQLRYDNVKEKSMAKINNDYQLILHGKVLVNLIITIIFPTESGVYVILMTILTGFGSVIMARKIIYESPKI